MRAFENEDGKRIIAINDIQADAFINAGFTEIELTEKLKKELKETE